jgi:hypothetical protein
VERQNRPEARCLSCGGRLIPLTFETPAIVHSRVRPSEVPERAGLKCLACGRRSTSQVGG